MNIAQKLVAALGLLGLIVALLFPVWSVSYVNTAGLDKWSRTNGGKPQQEELWSKETKLTAPKRALVFTGPTSKQFLEIPRDVTNSITNDNATLENPWQLISIQAASVNIGRLLLECSVIFIVTLCLVLLTRMLVSAGLSKKT